MGLDKKDFFGKSDPFYELGKQNPDGTFTTVYRSETIEATLSPRWRQHEINVKRLCGGQAEQPILVLNCLSFCVCVCLSVCLFGTTLELCLPVV